MLPKIDTPKFSFSQPSTGKALTFRPFLVKEEKILMLAANGGEINDMLDAAQQIVQNCCIEDVNIKDFTIFDLQYLFIKIKSKSTGEVQEFTLTCGEKDCNSKIQYELKLDDIEVTGLDNKVDSFIKVNDDVGIQLKYPTAEIALLGDELDDTSLIALCIDHVVNGEETIDILNEEKDEVDEFIDSLPLHAFDKVKEFFLNMPRMEHVIEYKCPKCERDNFIALNGYEHFFG